MGTMYFLGCISVRLVVIFCKRYRDMGKRRINEEVACIIFGIRLYDRKCTSSSRFCSDDGLPESRSRWMNLFLLHKRIAKLICPTVNP